MKFLSIASASAYAGLLLLIAAACGSSTSTGPEFTDLCAKSGSTATVSAGDNIAFSPVTVTVTVGQSVCWQNTGTVAHTVSDPPTAGTQLQGPLPPGQTSIRTFGSGGTFTYHCTQHSNMTGTVVVTCRPGEPVC